MKMVRLPANFIEDRALRDAARSVFLADIAHARTSLSAKTVATRVGEGIGDGARDVFEVAKVQAEDNRGILAILIGALLLWFAREPILEAFANGSEQDPVQDNLDGSPVEADPNADHAAAETDSGDDNE